MLIDCDLYSSTRDVLRFIEPLLAEECILIFDDWNCYNKDNNKGQRKAFGELLERRSDIAIEPLFEYGSWGAGFLVKSAGIARAVPSGSTPVVVECREEQIGNRSRRQRRRIHQPKVERMRRAH